MSETVKNVLSALTLLGILGHEFSYPKTPKYPFKADRKRLSADRRIIEDRISRTARRIRYAAETDRCQDYSS